MGASGVTVEASVAWGMAVATEASDMVEALGATDMVAIALGTMEGTGSTKLLLY